MENLYTLEGENMKGQPWTVYPRPQMRRENWINLNGEWEFSVNDQRLSENYEKTIRVPFCPESMLSGIQAHFPEGSALCYRKTLTLPEGFNRGRVLLHIGAADQVCHCFVNDKKVGEHKGGYEAFSLDITDALISGENEIKLCCYDDLTDLSFPYGKQTLKRGGMWYTPVSGIWQTV